MTELEQLLEEFRPANSNAAWQKTDPVDVLPVHTWVVPTETVERMKSLKEEAYAQGKLIYIVPANSWYHPGGTRGRQLTGDASRASKAAGIPVYDGIVKVNYGNHSYRALQKRPPVPSFFIGGIPKGSHVLLYDNTIETGATMRDMMRYVESSGAHVVGVVEGDGWNHRKHGMYDELFPESILPTPEVPPTDSIIRPDELIKFVRQGQQKPESLVHMPGSIAWSR